MYNEGNLVDTFVSVWGLNGVDTTFEVDTLRRKQHGLIGIPILFKNCHVLKGVQYINC